MLWKYVEKKCANKIVKIVSEKACIRSDIFVLKMKFIIHPQYLQKPATASTFVKRLKRILGNGRKSLSFYFATDMAKITQPCLSGNCS